VIQQDFRQCLYEREIKMKKKRRKKEKKKMSEMIQAKSEIHSQKIISMTESHSHHFHDIYPLPKLTLTSVVDECLHHSTVQQLKGGIQRRKHRKGSFSLQYGRQVGNFQQITERFKACRVAGNFGNAGTDAFKLFFGLDGAGNDAKQQGCADPEIMRKDLHIVV
jgi:hypothetical protein